MLPAMTIAQIRIGFQRLRIFEQIGNRYRVVERACQVAGFIGFHTVSRLLAAGITVHGLDNLNAYYDVRLKLDRLQRLRAHPRFRFVKADIADRPAIESLFAIMDDVTPRQRRLLLIETMRMETARLLAAVDDLRGAVSAASWCVLCVSWRDRSPLEEGFYQHFCNFTAGGQSVSGMFTKTR